MSASRLGVGTYKLKATKLDAATLYQSVVNGVRVIDTASHYSNGEAESIVGFVMNALLASGRGFQREDLVVVTKFGFVQDTEESKWGGFPESVRVSESLWSCIHPEYLETELKSSTARLGHSPDIVLLHNPEFFLADALKAGVESKPEEEFYSRIERAFRFLEQACAEGSISGYGISTNTEACKYSVTGYAHDKRSLYESTNLEKLLGCASNAAKQVHGVSREHSFRCLQMPFNVFEIEGLADFRRAQKQGIVTMANRPLNCIAAPGFGRGDWGRNDSHFKLRQGAPASPEQTLVNRILSDTLQAAGLYDMSSLAQKALWFASSPSSIDLTLSGPTRPEHVIDIATVIELQERIPHELLLAINEEVKALEEEALRN